MGAAEGRRGLPPTFKILNGTALPPARGAYLRPIKTWGFEACLPIHSILFGGGQGRLHAFLGWVRLYIFHCFIGYLLSAVFTALIIGFDVAGVGHLVTSVEGGWLAALVFFLLNGIVFAGVQFGIVLMSMPYPDR